MKHLEVTGFAHQLRSNKAIEITFCGTTGFSFFICWSLAMLSMPNILLDVTDIDRALISYVSGIAGILLACILMLFIRFAFPKIMKMRYKFISAVVGLVLGVVFSAVHLAGKGDDVFLIQAGFFLGFGTACMLLLWYRHFALFETRKKVILLFAIACIVGGLVYLIGICLIDAVCRVVFFATPFASLVVFQFAKGKPRRDEIELKQPKATSYVKRRFMVEALFGFAVSFSLGFLVRYLMIAEFVVDYMTFGILGASIISAGGIVFAGLLMINHNITTIFSFTLGIVTAISLVLICTGAKAFIIIALYLFWTSCTCILIYHISDTSQDYLGYTKLQIIQPILMLLIDTSSILLGMGLGIRFDGLGQSVSAEGCLVLLGIVSTCCLFLERLCLTTDSLRLLGGYDLVGADIKKNLEDDRALDEDEKGFDASPLDISYDIQVDESRRTSKLNKVIVQSSLHFGLSDRESEVFDYLARGHSARGISEKLFISIATVKTHTHNIYSKIGVHSRQELITYLEGLIMLLDEEMGVSEEDKMP